MGIAASQHVEKPSTNHSYCYHMMLLLYYGSFFDVQNPTSMIIALCYYQHNISNNNPTTIITTSMVIANPIPPNLKHSPKWSPESGKKTGDGMIHCSYISCSVFKHWILLSINIGLDKHWIFLLI